MTDPAGAYADAALQRLLAEDDGIAELGIDIVMQGDVVVLRGTVESEQRREEITRRVAEHLPECQIRDDIAVAPAQPPAGPEVLT
jgi:hypothetical protein